MLPERTGLDNELVGRKMSETFRYRKVSSFLEAGTAVAAGRNDDDVVAIVRFIKADSDVAFPLAYLRHQYLAVAVPVDLVKIGCAQGVNGCSNPCFVAQLFLRTITGLNVPLLVGGWRDCRRVDRGLSAALAQPLVRANLVSTAVPLLFGKAVGGSARA